MRQPRSDPGSSFTQIEQAVDQHRPRPASALELPVFQDRADRLLGALSAMKTWVLEFDDSGKMIYSSENAVNVIGFTAEEALDGNVVFHPDDLHILGDVVRKLRAEGETTKSVTRIRHKQGHWVWTEATLMAWTPSTQRNFHSLAFVRDITELKNAEAARSESEERYRLVSQMSFDLISEFDEKGEPIYVGPGVEEIMGFTREEVLDTEPFSLIHPEDEPRVRARFDAEFRGQFSAFDAATSKYTPRLMEYRARHRDGHWLSLETLGLTYRKENGQIRYLSVTRNVTEAKHAEIARRELEQSMLRAQKLESLGVLAGGIAHDFNNLLTPILGHAALGFDELPEVSPVRTRLRKIQEAANRVASLTNQLLAYAGQQPLFVESLNLSTLVAEMHELATSSVSGRTTLDLQLDPDLPTIGGEAAQLGQVVLNLITNAVESLGDGVGRITVRTGTTDIDAPPSRALFAETMTPGPHVFLEVRDTGGGMDPETCEKIFDPFFTTKFTGRGLGLAAVAGIVRSHHGAIEVESVPGTGTAFRVLLPVGGEPVGTAPAARLPIDDWHTTGTALVIDDDDSVREVAADILHRAGMAILTAADGHEGIKLFEHHVADIRLVLLDRTMPNLSGVDTFQRIRAIEPKAKVILMSGYSEERATADLAQDLHGLDGFLMKPFEPETLLLRVRKALGDPGSR